MLKVIKGGRAGKLPAVHLHSRTVWACQALLEESDPCSLSVHELGAFRARLHDLLDEVAAHLAGQRCSLDSYWCPTCGDSQIPLNVARCDGCELELQNELASEPAVPR